MLAQIYSLFPLTVDAGDSGARWKGSGSSHEDRARIFGLWTAVNMQIDLHTNQA